MSSSTTATFANGSFGAVVSCALARGNWAWLSETTGTRVGACVLGACAVGVMRGWAILEAFGSAGRGAGCRRAGTWRSGKPMSGSERAGSGVWTAAIVGCLNTAATGTAYIATSTSRPRPAHQYRTPLNLNAVSP
jgi:hypothetical protein